MALVSTRPHRRAIDLTTPPTGTPSPLRRAQDRRSTRRPLTEEHRCMIASTTTFGVDLITFYHPHFWGGVQTHDEVVEIGRADPAAMWDRILGGLVEAGITDLEMTFPPADWRSALE